MKPLLNFEALGAFVSLLYPPACAICSDAVPAGEYLCTECHDKTPRIVAPFCEKCSEPFAGAITASFSCANCAHQTLHFEAAVSAYQSKGVVRRLVHDFKYRSQIHLRHL